MAVTHEDIQELKNVFDDRYVLQSDCNDKQESVNKKLSNDDKRIDILLEKFGTVGKLLWVIASSVIGALVLELLGLVLK